MNKKIISIIVLAAIILAFSFYWFQLRPYQIRKECSKNLTGFSSVGRGEKDYTNCLRENGLEK